MNQVYVASLLDATVVVAIQTVLFTRSPSSTRFQLVIDRLFILLSFFLVSLD